VASTPLSPDRPIASPPTATAITHVTWQPSPHHTTRCAHLHTRTCATWLFCSPPERSSFAFSAPHTPFPSGECVHYHHHCLYHLPVRLHHLYATHAHRTLHTLPACGWFTTRALRTPFTPALPSVLLPLPYPHPPLPRCSRLPHILTFPSTVAHSRTPSPGADEHRARPIHHHTPRTAPYSIPFYATIVLGHGTRCCAFPVCCACPTGERPLLRLPDPFPYRLLPSCLPRCDDEGISLTPITQHACLRCRVNVTVPRNAPVADLMPLRAACFAVTTLHLCALRTCHASYAPLPTTTAPFFTRRLPFLVVLRTYASPNNIL